MPHSKGQRENQETRKTYQKIEIPWPLHTPPKIVQDIHKQDPRRKTYPNVVTLHETWLCLHGAISTGLEFAVLALINEPVRSRVTHRTDPLNQCRFWLENIERMAAVCRNGHCVRVKLGFDGDYGESLCLEKRSVSICNDSPNGRTTIVAGIHTGWLWRWVAQRNGKNGGRLKEVFWIEGRVLVVGIDSCRV